MSEAAIREILAHFTEDAVWHNMPIGPAIGKQAIAEMLRQAVPPPESLDIEIKSIATHGTTVLAEHTDTHRGADRTIVIPCCGVFETRAGLITSWRDYFDLRSWHRQAGS